MEEVEDKTPLSTLISHLTNRGCWKDLVIQELQAVKPALTSRPLLSVKQFRNANTCLQG